MKKFLPGLLLGLALGAFATWIIMRGSRTTVSEDAESAPAATLHKPESGLHLSPQQIAAAGLLLAPPTIATLAPTVEAYGRVLDLAPLISAAAEVATAKATFAASEREFARAKLLRTEGNNASDQSVEAAEAAAQRDRVQLDSARARFIASWGPELAARLDSGFLADLMNHGWALARIDVPPGEPAIQTGLKSVRIAALTGDLPPVDAEIIGPSPSADPQLQGRGYFVLLRDQPPPTGAALRAALSREGTATSCLTLPRSAFVRHEGSVFVYVAAASGKFERRRVELGSTLPDAIAVLSGLNEHDQVVVTGAQQLLSSELGAGGGGD